MYQLPMRLRNVLTVVIAGLAAASAVAIGQSLEGQGAWGSDPSGELFPTSKITRRR